MDMEAGPLSPSPLTADDMNNLVQHLGRFALGMMVTFIQHRDEIPEPANHEFIGHITAWNAVASEFIDMDAAVREAMDAGA